MLVTAGPTQEPIDLVRYIGNRSSGRLGMELTGLGAARGHDMTLLLGPLPAREDGIGDSPRSADYSHAKVKRFRTTADLQHLLEEEARPADVVIMAAAVADYRPKGVPGAGKLRREAAGLTLELEATPDLLAGLGKSRLPGQLLVGFALEPRERLVESAREKLARKSIDLIVANELETMESENIEARVLGRNGEDFATPGKISKAKFAAWLFDIIERAVMNKRAERGVPGEQ